MLNSPRPSCVWTLLLCSLAILAAPTAKAQETAPLTALDKQLAHVDLAISGLGSFNKDSNGTAIVNSVPTAVNLSPGNTLGVLITLRYIKSPFIGGEFNYGYSRYTENFTPFGSQPIGGVQQNASEFTVGYVAHAPKPFFGVLPFAAVGLGTTTFRPTPGGGEGLLEQARATYYYSIGVEQTFGSPHFGFRAQFRQAFFKAPDFETNYLTIQQHTSTIEPGVGFFLRF
jgi:hypothetical protein